MVGFKKVRFIRAFTSPQYGNVWIGREVIVSHKQAVRFIEEKLAEEVRKSDGGRGNTGRSKAAPAGDDNG